MTKILITGASGYLGQTLTPIAATQADIIGIARNTDTISEHANAIAVDIQDRASVMDIVRSHKPDAIIHCAACNPGGSDTDMFAVNEHGTGNIADAASESRCRLVAVSSDTVFNGQGAPFSDDAAASPLLENIYAVSKARGEALIRTRAPSAAIVRTSLIYGTDKIDRGTEGFANRLASGQTLKLFNDVIRQPVDCRSLSSNLCALALKHTNENGFINIMGNEALSRYDFGVRMLDYWGIDYNDRLEAVSGVGIAGLPIDLRVTMDRAMQLALPTPGLTEVLGLL